MYIFLVYVAVGDGGDIPTWIAGATSSSGAVSGTHTHKYILTHDPIRIILPTGREGVCYSFRTQEKKGHRRVASDVLAEKDIRVDFPVKRLSTKVPPRKGYYIIYLGRPQLL